MAEYFLGAGEEHPFYDGILLPNNGLFDLPSTICAGITLKEDAYSIMIEYV